MKKFIALLLLPILVACGKPLPKLTASDFNGRTVTFVEQEGAPFIEYTFGAYTEEYFDFTPSSSASPSDRARKAVDGKLAKVIAAHSPAPAIFKDTKAFILRHYNMKEVKKNADYVVSLHYRWGMNPHPFIVTSYNVYFNTDINLTEPNVKDDAGNNRSRVLARCYFSTDSKYAYDTLYRDDAATIADVAKEARQECTSKLQEDLKKRYN